MVVTARLRSSKQDAGTVGDSQDRTRSLGLLSGIVLVGIVVRFTTLGEQSFWYDEAVTHGIVAHGLGHVFSTIPKTESTPPLYYVLVWLWSRVFGVHEVGLRSFSAVCGTLTIPVVWAIGRRLISDRVGLVAAVLTAVNPLLFWYSQEARSYALLVLLSALSLWGLAWALEAPTRRRLLGWGALSALALTAHYFAAFLIAAEAVWLLVALRRAGLASPAHIAAALGPIVVVAAALLPLAIHQNDGRAGFIAGSGSVAFRLAQLVKQDIVANDEPAKVLTSVIGAVLVLLGLLVLVLRGNRRERGGVLMPLSVGTGAILLALLVAAGGTDYVLTRNLLPSWPALVVVVAAGFGAGGAGRLGLAALAALVAVNVICVVGVITTPLFQRADWRGAARAMGPATVTRAIVGDRHAETALGPYMAHLSAFPPTAQVQEVDVFALIYRRPGAHVSSSPPRPASPPVLPGFKLAQIRVTDSYTVLRYRSPAPVAEQATTLVRLGLTPFGAYAALLQAR